MEFDNEMETSATILDILNEDCWRIILDMIQIEDIIRSERVSRQWQNMILQYLQGVHFSIEGPLKVHRTLNKLWVLKRVLKLNSEFDLHELKLMTEKWGANIKKAYCYNGASLEVLARNCPNLEHIVLIFPRNCVSFYPAPALAQGNFMKLRTVYIANHKTVTDKWFSKWLGKVSIEELYIFAADKLTGRFLVDIPTSLNTLSLQGILNLEFQYLLSANLTGLKKLELIDLPAEIFPNLHVLLDKLPNLVDLCVRMAKPFTRELAQSISRLELRRLDLSYNELLNDEWLEIIARGCGRLREFEVERCIGVSERGIGAVCRVAGAALRALNLSSNHTIDDPHVLAFVTDCPNLTLLDLVYGMGITEKLVDIVGEVTSERRLRMRLMVENTMVEGFHEDRYPWLILDFGDGD